LLLDDLRHSPLFTALKAAAYQPVGASGQGTGASAASQAAWLLTEGSVGGKLRTGLAMVLALLGGLFVLVSSR
jgi:hypothetical protein